MKKKVIAGELPADWQGGNLCRISPALMDEFRVAPGGLLKVASLDERQTSFTRIGPRCTDFVDSRVEVELDPALMDFLGISDTDAVGEINISNEEEPSVLMSLNLECVDVSLSNQEKEKYIEFIKKFRWPVYHNGLFMVNLAGDALCFYVNRQNNESAINAVVGADTLITIHDAKEQEIFRLTNQIRIINASLLDFSNDILHKERTLKDLENELQQVENLGCVVSDQERQLLTKRDLLRSELKGIPAQQENLEKRLADIQQEIVNLTKSCDAARTEMVDVGLDGLEQERDLTKDKLLLLFAEIEGNDID